ncbi:hypothetical protein BH20ACT3_BH20ACT3_01510 [soil metagenome]|jgi:hypothetical protein
MALSQKHRTALFTKLAPLVGEEETEAMLAEFPSNDLDAPATKDFVRAEVGQLRTEFRHEIGQLRTELASMEVRIGERMRGQMIWLTGVVVAALGLLRALGG